MLRVRTDFTGMSNGPAFSNLYFDGAGSSDAAAANTAVGAFWAAMANGMINYGIATTEPTVAELGLAGVLTAFWPVAPIAHSGALTDTALPPADQGLLRLHTGLVIGHRQLIGHVFLPGACESNNTSGGVADAGYIALADAAGAGLIAATIPWVVWSRAHAAMYPIVSASTAAKWAILRSRRD